MPLNCGCASLACNLDKLVTQQLQEKGANATFWLQSGIKQHSVLYMYPFVHSVKIPIQIEG